MSETNSRSPGGISTGSEAVPVYQVLDDVSMSQVSLPEFGWFDNILCNSWFIE